MMQDMGGLPGAYQRVEYLESSGTQYINTGIKTGTGNRVFEFIAMSQYPPSSGQRIVLGCGANAGQYIAISNNVWVAGGAAAYQTSASVFEWQKIYCDFSMTDGVRVTINGETLLRPGTATTNVNFCLFSDVSMFYPASVMIKICTCYINGEKVQNLIPCVRKSDSKPGMYDTVSKTFYTNAGTGDFIIPT